jgi:hypothetical protein
MKKLLTTFLISLTLLTFSNTVSASFFGDIFKGVFGDNKKPSDVIGGLGNVNTVRCKVEYTQLDLATGLEKTVKHSDQYNTDDLEIEADMLYLLTQDLTDKINIWLNESENNIITNLTIINCKERRLFTSMLFWQNEERWGEYKGCEDEYNVELINLLDRPNQWGYNVHKTRLIKDYEDGCKNYKLGLFGYASEY